MFVRKGDPKAPGSGRKKGTPNKATADLKAAILDALEASGGIRYLVKLAKDNPAAFATLLGKVLPMTVKGDANAPFIVQIVRFSDEASE